MTSTSSRSFATVTSSHSALRLITLESSLLDSPHSGFTSLTSYFLVSNNMEKSSIATPAQHLVAGTIGGLGATLIFYPLDCLKTRMQVIDTHNFRSLSSAFYTTIRLEGIRGLYRGLLPAATASAASWGGFFYLYENSKKRKLLHLPPPQQLQSWDHLSAGFEAGIALVFLFNPLWLIKTRLTLQGTVPSAKQQYKGMWDAFATIKREEGILGFYKGIAPAILLTSHGAVQFASYEFLKKMMDSVQGNTGKDQASSTSLALGALSKVIASIVTYPYQLVKSRLQQGEALVAESDVKSAVTTASKDTNRITITRYTGTMDCIIQIWRLDGPSGYFRGMLPNALKVAPASAMTFLVYEECLKLMRKYSVFV